MFGNLNEWNFEMHNEIENILNGLTNGLPVKMVKNGKGSCRSKCWSILVVWQGFGSGHGAGSLVQKVVNLLVRPSNGPILLNMKNTNETKILVTRHGRMI